MTTTEPDYRLCPVDQVELRLTTGTWGFARDHQAAIAEHWRELTAANPALFNGTLLLMAGGGLMGGMFKADLIEVDYASFISWRDWGWCDTAVHDCYGSAVVMSCDGALLMGRMGDHTINAGMVYPPGGSLTREDLLPNGEVDMTASIARELYEETGLVATDAACEGVYMAASDQRIAIGQVLRFADDAETLAARVREHIASEDQPELCEVVTLRRPGDVAPELMPPHARAFSSALL